MKNRQSNNGLLTFLVFLFLFLYLHDQGYFTFLIDLFAPNVVTIQTETFEIVATPPAPSVDNRPAYQPSPQSPTPTIGAVLVDPVPSVVFSERPLINYLVETQAPLVDTQPTTQSVPQLGYGGGFLQPSSVFDVLVIPTQIPPTPIPTRGRLELPTIWELLATPTPECKPPLRCAANP